MKGKADDKGQLFGNVVITLCFAALLMLVLILSALLVSTERLHLENYVERTYSNLIMAMNQGETQLIRTLEDEGVLGFGYYSNSGYPYYVWGNAYQRLPLTSFPESSGRGSYISSYNEEREVIESVRYTYPPGVDPDRFLRSGEGPLVFPDIIFISFDSSSAEAAMRLIVITIAAAIAVLSVLYIVAMMSFRQNAEYRETLRRQENLVSMGQAARTLTHEIKNPLSAIKLQLALLKRESPPELMDDIALIDSETRRLVALTDKVSDFLRNPRGNPANADLVETMRKLVQVFSHQIELVADIEPAVVYFDADRLRSVLENLLKNAVEATEDGSPVECEITIDKRKQYHVYVRDRGIGIDAGEIRKIFDPFYTTKINGSGIGLAITRQFVEAAGGSISLYPRIGGGTVAEIVIPAADNTGRSIQ